MRLPGRALGPAAAASLAALLGLGSHVLAQTPEALAAECVDASGDPALCLAAALAGQSVIGHLGLASGLGSEVPGTASALGQRLGTSPRIAPALRVGLVRAAMPDLSDPDGLDERAFSGTAVQASVALGLFDGFRLMPTVGGFLSFDAFGHATWVLLPEDEGFDGRVAAYTIGGRVGILREGFTLPGVTVSVARRFVGDVGLGDVGAGDAAEVRVDPSVTSLRATVGKDLFAVEVLGGFGWDDYAADAAFEVGDGAGGVALGTGSLDATRRIWFVSVSRAFNLVFSLTLEGGVARGFDPVAGYAGAYDPEAGRAFGGLAFRLTI